VSTLHITNGDCAAAILRQFVDGPVVTTCDPLYEGPVPVVNGEFDRAMSEANPDTEIVLWFEHDLYDQLLLIRALDFLDRTGVSLICIDRFPGVEPFYGLGQLTAGQMAPLLDARRAVTAEQYALAAEAWDAFRNPDPAALCTLTHALKTDSALPFLGAALARFLAEYPSVANGLTRTEELALRGLDTGPLAAGTLFAATQSRESAPFMGDWSFYDGLRRLASSRVPLVTIDGDAEVRDLRQHLVRITQAGRDILGGRRDAIALNGIDVWRGGVHLAGIDRSPWRWDASRETLVS
jgi:hypothetical protein